MSAGSGRRLGARAHTLRIIGGEWRGRRIAIDTGEGLRPTPDRVRETLFNWLAPRIEGARCLDLYAGTGALGLEALSRGAGHVTFIERRAASTHALQKALQTLGASNARVVHGDALVCAPALASGFDVVFVDPPFEADLYAPSLSAIVPLISAQTRVYLEYPAAGAKAANLPLPPAWRVLRAKRAGAVGYCLASRAPERKDTDP